MFSESNMGKPSRNMYAANSKALDVRGEDLL